MRSNTHANATRPEQVRSFRKRMRTQRDQSKWLPSQTSTARYMRMQVSAEHIRARVRSHLPRPQHAQVGERTAVFCARARGAAGESCARTRRVVVGAASLLRSSKFSGVAKRTSSSRPRREPLTLCALSVWPSRGGQFPKRLGGGAGWRLLLHMLGGRTLNDTSRQDFGGRLPKCCFCFSRVVPMRCSCVTGCAQGVLVPHGQ